MNTAPRRILVQVERDHVCQGWLAQIGAAKRSRRSSGSTPSVALLNLCALLRSDGWWFAEEDTLGDVPDSPNVIALRPTGPPGFQSWTASGAGGRHPLAVSTRDPVDALAGFALKLRGSTYLFDAEFRFTTPPAVRADD